MNENEYENELSDDEQSQQTMAESYANVVQTNLSRNSKPPDVQDPIDDGIDNPKTVKLDDEQSQQTMTESYVNVVQTNLSRNCITPDVQDTNDDEIDNPNTVKPIILQDQEIFSSVKVIKPMWFTHVEIFKTIGAVVEPAAIKGIQKSQVHVENLHGQRNRQININNIRCNNER